MGMKTLHSLKSALHGMVQPASLRDKSDESELARCVHEKKEAKEKLRRAKEALNLFAQQSFAATAAQYLREGRKLADHAEIGSLIQDDLLHKHVFSQKTPNMLGLYQRLLLGGVSEPKRIFEIGIKNGGSLVLWRALFPQAKIVGMDLGLSKTTKHDSIIYVAGDQSDSKLLGEIGEKHGPFDLIIDDGSHICDHQIKSLRVLNRYISPGGTYVIEDVHAPLKKSNGEQYGPDVWAEFVTFLFAYLRRQVEKNPNLPPHIRAAKRIAPRVADVILAQHTLAIRFADQSAPKGMTSR